MNISVIKAGGVFAILTAAAFVTGTVFFVIAGLEEDPDKTAIWLQAVYENTAIVVATPVAWFFGALFIIPASLGIFQALNSAGRVLWYALAFLLVGVTILFLVLAVAIGIMIQLPAEYAGASDAMKQNIVVMTKALTESFLLAEGVALSFMFGISGILFNIGVLRTSVIRRWIGWLGLVAGVASLGWILFSTFMIFQAVAGIGYILTLVWMLAIGVSLIRLQEPAG